MIVVERPLVGLLFMAAIECRRGRCTGSPCWVARLLSFVATFTADGSPLSGVWS